MLHHVCSSSGVTVHEFPAHTLHHVHCTGLLTFVLFFMYTRRRYTLPDYSINSFYFVNSIKHADD